MLSSGPFGYIDPVSGSILLQVIAAGIIGAIGYFFRPLWRIVRRLFGCGAGVSPATDTAGGTPAPQGGIAGETPAPQGKGEDANGTN